MLAVGTKHNSEYVNFLFGYKPCEMCPFQIGATPGSYQGNATPFK